MFGIRIMSKQQAIKNLFDSINRNKALTVKPYADKKYFSDQSNQLIEKPADSNIAFIFSSKGVDHNGVFYTLKCLTY